MEHHRSDWEGRLKSGVSDCWRIKECLFGLVEMQRLLQFLLVVCVWQTTAKHNELLKTVTFVLLTNLQFDQAFLDRSFQL